MNLSHRFLSATIFCQSPNLNFDTILNQNRLPQRKPERYIEKHVFFQDHEVPETWVSDLRHSEEGGKVVWFEERPQPIRVDFLDTWKDELKLPMSQRTRAWMKEMQHAREIGFKNNFLFDKTEYWIQLQNDNSYSNNSLEPTFLYMKQFPWSFEGKSSLDFLASLSFTEALFCDVHGEWGLEPSFYEMLYQGLRDVCPSNCISPQTWALAFQGEGHQRMLSRRWIEYGPWHVLYLENDTTFLFLFDLLAPFEEALLQILESHRTLNRFRGGGYLELVNQWGVEPWEWQEFPGDIHVDPEAHTVRLKIRDDSPIMHRILTDLCTIRLPQLHENLLRISKEAGVPIPDHRYGLKDEEFVDRIQCVFPNEALARRYLHETWLREMECWWVQDDGQEIRLDDRYSPPPPQKPKWVEELANAL